MKFVFMIYCDIYKRSRFWGLTIEWFIFLYYKIAPKDARYKRFI